MRARPFGWFRLATQVLGGSVAVDAAQTTFVADDDEPDADGMPVDLTFTARDADGVGIPGRTVTYA